MAVTGQLVPVFTGVLQALQDMSAYRYRRISHTKKAGLNAVLSAATTHHKDRKE